MLLAFVWDETASGTVRNNTLCSLLFQSQSRPIVKGGSDQLCSPSFLLLFAVQEPIQKRGATLLQGSPYGENCACRMSHGTSESNIFSMDRFVGQPIFYLYIF